MNTNQTRASLSLNNKKHEYTITIKSDGTVFFECEAANIAQDFLAADIPALLVDLPHLIIVEQEYKKRQSDVMRFRIMPEERELIESRAAKMGHASVSSFLREAALAH